MLVVNLTVNRLEASEVYRGSAWWIAEIVDRQPLQGKYKIRYPGWDQRWDEWVPQHRLRWAVESNIVARIQVGDAVEVIDYYNHDFLGHPN